MKNINWIRHGTFEMHHYNLEKGHGIQTSEHHYTFQKEQPYNHPNEHRN